MVFESVVVELVNRFLGDYIENLDTKQLSISIWGGDIVLSNLFVKENLLRELELPVRVLYGNIGQLTLKIPWKNLYSEPTVAILDGLYVIVVPNTSIAYNEEKETKAKWDAKQSELAKIEDAKKREAEKDMVKDAKADSFVEKLIANVIKNLEVTVTNIHVRFEDNVTNPQAPFSVGVTLHELSLRTTDENWQLRIIKEAAAVIFKLVQLDSLSVYWNCCSESFHTKEKSAIQPLLKSTIAYLAQKVDFLYLIEPMTSSARLALNMKPEQTGFSMPKILLDVVFEEIVLALAKNQYQILMEFIESLERMQLSDKFRKYRRNIPHHQHSREWWKFAYTCILEETVRRRRRMWSWQHMKEHRQTCLKYKDLYKSKLQTSKPSSQLLADIEKCERELDVFNITIIRQQAELLVKKEGGKKDGKSGGWLGGWLSWGSKPSSSAAGDKSAVADKVQEVMTAEEKQKLYAAIGYQENAVDTDFPKEFIAINLQLKLTKLCLKLRDTSLKRQEVMSLELNNIAANVAQRPAACAVGVRASLESLNVFGLPLAEDGLAPVMASSMAVPALTVIPGGKFLDLLFETNPLDGTCDTRIGVGVQPLQIIYDAKTINCIAEFFKPPDNVYVVQLQAAAMAQLDSVKQQTATGLQYALEQKKFTEISVSLQPTCIIIPEQGVYTQDCRMMVLDLGELSIATEKPGLPLAATEGAPPMLSLQELQKQAFTKFSIKLKSVQLLFANKGEQWLDVRSVSSSSLHVLRPMAINIDLLQCVIPSTDLPKMKVVGELPSLSVSLSDQRLCDILGLVSSIPFPEGRPPPSGAELEEENIQGPDARLMPIREDAVELVGKLAADNQQAASNQTELQNATNMELHFEIKEICIQLAQRKGDVDIPTLKVVIESLGVQLTARDFDTSVSAYLGGIYVQHVLFKAFDEIIQWHADHGVRSALSDGPLVNLINTPIMDGNAFKLLKVDVLMANKKHPQFSTTYANTLQKIVVEFSILEVLLHQEALLSTLAMVQSIQRALEKPQPPQETWPVVVHRQQSLVSSSISGAVSKKLEKIERRPRRKKEGVEVIDMSLSATLNNLSVGICTQDHMLTDIKITGLSSQVTLQKSKTTVSASLKDISVFDHIPDAIFPKILSFEGGDVFKMAAIVHNGATEGKNYLDMRIVDTEVSLEMGCMKIVFLNKFVQNLLTFAAQFQAAKDKLSEASAAVADRATAAAQDLSTRSSRLSLDIRLKAPVIIVPQSSRSNNAVVVDLGRLTVSNSFQLTGGSQRSTDGLPAVLDHMVVDLNLLKISRALVMGTEVQAECQLLEPVSLSLKLTRNLSASWFHGSPDIELYGKLQNFSMLVSQGDLKTVMQLLNENLQEGNPPPSVGPPSPTHPTDSQVCEVPAVIHPAPDSSSAVVSEPSSPKSSPAADQPKEVHQTVKLNIAIDKIKLELYSGDSDLSVGESRREIAHALARFQLRAIGLTAEMFSDTSIKAQFSLSSIDLDDIRPNRENGITKMVLQSAQAAASVEPINMIDVSFLQDSHLNKEIDMKVNGLHVVVALEYLMKLKDFVMDAMPPAAAATPLSSSSMPRPAAAPVQQPPPPPAIGGGETKIQMLVVNPEIVLVENTTNIDANAILLSLHIEALVRISAVHQIIKGSIKRISVISCIYAEEKRDASKSHILMPLDIDIQSNAPSGKNHHAEIYFMSDVVLNISSAAIRTITATLSSLSAAADEKKEDELVKIPKDLWIVRKFTNSDFWFLKSVEELADPVSGAAQLEKELSKIEQIDERGEQLVLGKCRIIVKLLGGVGRRTVPFIITDMSLRNVDIRNWSTMLSMSSELTLEVAYYNEGLAVWEPLIEPVEADLRHRPWEIGFEMYKTDLLEWDEVDAGETLPPAQTVMNVVSNDVLQLTVSKTAMEVFANLGQSFGDAYRLVAVHELEDAGAPFIVKNETGTYITVKPGTAFQMPENAVDEQVGLDRDRSLNLFHKVAEIASEASAADSPFTEVLDDETKILTLTFDDLNASRELTVKRAEKRSFSFDQRSSPGEVWQIIAQTDMAYGCKIVTIRSNVQVHNCLPYGVELYYKLGDDAMGRCGDVNPGDTASLPCEAIYTSPYIIFFKPREGSYHESAACCSWTDVKPDETRIIECKAWKGNSTTVYFVTKVAAETVLFESTTEATAKSFTIELNPTVVFRNFLPMDIACKMEGMESLMNVEVGDKTPLLNANPGQSAVIVTLYYQNKEWTGRISIDAEPADLAAVAFETMQDADKLTMDLGVHCEKLSSGSLQLSLYCPYWMINKTQRHLSYKASEDYIVEHKADNNDIVLFLFKNSSASNKQKQKSPSKKTDDPKKSKKKKVPTATLR